jgi:hypothetical protein
VTVPAGFPGGPPATGFVQQVVGESDGTVAVALITAREDPAVSREAVLEGCELSEALAGMEEIAAVVMGMLPFEERERLLRSFGLTAITASGEA